MTDRAFEIVGQRKEQEHKPTEKKKWYQGKPVLSIGILAVILIGCLFAEAVMTKDPTYMDLLNYNKGPGREFLFGTDTMGRDIFSMIWYGGRISLLIGVLSTVISTFIAVVVGAFSGAAPGWLDNLVMRFFSMIWYGGRISLLIGVLSTVISTFIAVVVGAFSGAAPGWLDNLVMRFTEIFLSIPSLLLVILLQAIMGKANVVSLSVVIGITSWTSIAKVVRTEVRQIRNSEYVIASRCMGGGFFHILWKHLAPNFISSIMFMVIKVVRTEVRQIRNSEYVIASRCMGGGFFHILWKHLAPNFISSIMFMVIMNVRTAIISESTLSFMGIGLPLEIVSWGSMLSLSEKALMTNSWWIILIPGIFLVGTESTLSFMGIGLPLEIVSWGSMLSLSEKALMTNSWWIILIPGIFLVGTLLCLTNIGNYMRKNVNRKESNL